MSKGGAKTRGHDLPKGIRFGPDGLVPVITQDASSGEVLTLAYANEQAIRTMLRTGYVHFWSRSRGKLWKKGEDSGNVQRLVSLRVDCDGDAVLARVRPAGPACHRGTPTCFDEVHRRSPGDSAILAELVRTIRDRARKRPVGSYTTELLGDRLLLLKKVGEEAFEVVHAAHLESDRRLAEESADLLYHLLVLLESRGVDLADVWEVLEGRHGTGVRTRRPSRKRTAGGRR